MYGCSLDKPFCTITVTVFYSAAWVTPGPLQRVFQWRTCDKAAGLQLKCRNWPESCESEEIRMVPGLTDYKRFHVCRFSHSPEVWSWDNITSFMACRIELTEKQLLVMSPMSNPASQIHQCPVKTSNLVPQNEDTSARDGPWCYAVALWSLLVQTRHCRTANWFLPMAWCLPWNRSWGSGPRKRWGQVGHDVNTC